MQLHTEDGLTLEAELALPNELRAGLVICHPHPLHGGSMRSIVPGALFEGLSHRGVACLRFNFRGVGGSEGSFDAGNGERLDAEAALLQLRETLDPAVPIGIAGWSFGADVCLSVRDSTHRGWFAVAPPLQFVVAVEETAADPRPKRVVLGQHDQFRAPEEVEAEMATWTNARAEVIGGSDHYFIGRTDRLVDLADAFLNEIARDQAASTDA